MRNVAAAFLVQHHRRGGWSIHAVAQTILHIDKDVRQLAILHHILLRVFGVFVATAAGRVLCHIDHDCASAHPPLNWIVPDDGAGRCRINLRIGIGLLALLVESFLVTASGVRI